MQQTVKRLLLHMLLAITVSLVTGDTMTASSALPAATSAATIAVSGNDAWCLFCGRYEGHAVHPITLQWEPVVYAYCEDWQINGGGTGCQNPPNDWNYFFEWEGDVCELTPYNGDWGDARCDCEYEAPNPFPYDPLQIDDCSSETPVGSVAADGFLATVSALGVTERPSPINEVTCTGIIASIAMSARDVERLRMPAALSL
jgi:hypothetical protein